MLQVLGLVMVKLIWEKSRLMEALSMQKVEEYQLLVEEMLEEEEKSRLMEV